VNQEHFNQDQYSHTEYIPSDYIFYLLIYLFTYLLIYLFNGEQIYNIHNPFILFIMNHTVSLQAYDGSTIIISFDNAIAIATLLQQYREQTGYGGCIELFDMEHPTERPLEHSMVVDSNKMFLVQKSEFEAIPDKDTLQQLVDRYCDDSFTDEEREHYGPIENWNIRLITNLSELFRDIPHFNQSLNNWDTSHVTNMNCMFSDAFAFNKPLDNWDVSNVSNMCSMFHDAKVFNQPLNNWDVSHNH